MLKKVYVQMIINVDYHILEMVSIDMKNSKQRSTSAHVISQVNSAIIRVKGT